MPPYRGVGLSSGGALTHSGARFRGIHGRYVKGPGGATIFDEIGPRVAFGPKITEEAVMEQLNWYAEQIEEWMKENAPWNDVDTPHSYAGETRDGLKAEAQGSYSKYNIVVYHTVPWGIWLEVRWNGRYAILLPTIEEWGPHVIQELNAF